VQAVDLDGVGEWSPSWKFSTLKTGLYAIEIGRNGIIVYPNPTTGKFRVRGSGLKG